MHQFFTARRKRFVCFLLITPALAGILLMFGQKPALASNPTTINFQGKIVRNDAGNVGINVPDGSYSIVFRIYNTATPTTSTPCSSDSTCLFEETQSSVSVTNGVFQVELGSTCSPGGLVGNNSCTKSVAGGIDFNAQSSLYLTLKFYDDSAFMSPTIHLTTVPYAYNADELGGISSSGFIQNNSGTAQSNSYFHISNTGVADVQLQAPLFDTAISNGTLGIGTTNAGAMTIGNVTNSTVLFNLKNSSATALQINNGSNNSLFTVDTSGNDIALGKIGTGGINGSIVFNTTNSSNTTVTIAAASTGTSYSLTLPTTGPSTSQCLGTDPSTASQLIFTTCGGSGANTTLSNLTDTVAINKSLLPGTGNSINLGSASKSWATAFENVVQTASATNLQLQSATGLVSINTASPSSGNELRVYDSTPTHYTSITYGNISTDSGNLTLSSGSTNIQLQAANGIVALNKTGVNNEIDIYENSSNGTNYGAITVTDTTATFQSHGGVTHIGGGTGAITVGSSSTTGITIAGSTTAAVTITGNAGSTWSTSAGNALTITGGSALALDSQTTGAITIGTNANNKTITIGAGGSTSSNSTVDIANSSAGAQTVVLGSTSSTSATTIQGGSGNTGVNILSGGNVQIGTSDTTGTLLITDTKTNSGEPTGVNGAIYYNAGGNGGANVATYGGKFRCFEGGIWKNCIGMRDIVERRWGYAATTSVTAAALTGFGNIASLTAAGTNATGPQADSNYVNYTSATTSLPKEGGVNGPLTQTEARWLPKLVMKVHTDGQLTTNGRLWIGLTSATEVSQTVPTTASSLNTTVFLGIGYETGVNGGKFLCVSSDGLASGGNISGTDTTVTATTNEIYDIIVDYSTSGTLVCSIADDGAVGSFSQGAFTTVSKTSNVPTTSTPSSTALGIEAGEILKSGTPGHVLSISYAYLESN